MSDETLKQCPFCGWEQPRFVPAEIVNNEVTEDGYVRCEECGTIGPSGPDGNDDEARNYWNRRTNPVAESGPTGGNKNGADVDALAEKIDDFLRRLSEWDHFDTASDGSYWRGEIVLIRESLNQTEG